MADHTGRLPKLFQFTFSGAVQIEALAGEAPEKVAERVRAHIAKQLRSRGNLTFDDTLRVKPAAVSPGGD